MITVPFHMRSALGAQLRIIPPPISLFWFKQRGVLMVIRGPLFILVRMNTRHQTPFEFSPCPIVTFLPPDTLLILAPRPFSCGGADAGVYECLFCRLKTSTKTLWTGRLLLLFYRPSFSYNAGVFQRDPPLPPSPPFLPRLTASHPCLP